MESRKAELKKRALTALHKKAEYGPDIDIEKYDLEEPEIIEGIEGAEENIVRRLSKQLGFGRTPPLSYIQIDERAYYSILSPVFKKYGVVVKPLSIAIKEDPRVAELAWKLVPVDTDKYTAATHLYGGEIGYYVYVPPGVEFPYPIYTCLGIFTGRAVQFAHNIVYVDEGAVAHVTTGCMIPHGVQGGLHIGVSEFYIAKGAKLVYTMFHSWVEGTHVRPRTAVKVEEGGEYISYYVIYSPVGSIQTFPKVHLSRGATTQMITIVAGRDNGIYDVGSKAVLDGRNSSAELISRMVASRKARVMARSQITSNSAKTRGHIECLGLLLDDQSYISSVPEINSTKREVQLTHEAAIGMISGDKIEYLMSKGFTEDEARSMLLRGFLTIETPKLPPQAKKEIDQILQLVIKKAVG